MYSSFDVSIEKVMLRSNEKLQKCPRNNSHDAYLRYRHFVTLVDDKSHVIRRSGSHTRVAQTMASLDELAVHTADLVQLSVDDTCEFASALDGDALSRAAAQRGRCHFMCGAHLQDAVASILRGGVVDFWWLSFGSCRGMRRCGWLLV